MMLKDFGIYQDCRRNDPCPCGSGKTFKACCLKEHREARRQIKEITVLPFSPLRALESKQKKMVTDLYGELMLFAYRRRIGNSPTIPIDDMTVFLQKERKYFFDDREKYLDTFRLSRQFDEDENRLLDGIEKARFGNYIHISHNDQTAVLLDFSENRMLGIKALNDSFDSIFGKDNGLIGIQTVVIPFENRLISDGIYGAFKIEKQLESAIHEWLLDGASGVHHQEQPTIYSGPFIISAAFMAHPHEFEMMEKCLLEKISDGFYHDLRKLIGGSGLYFERIVPFEGFLRSTDLTRKSNLLIDKERTFEEVVMYYSDWIQGESTFVPMGIWNEVYCQPILVNSASGPSMIPKLAKAKKNPLNEKHWTLGYFSMVGYVSLHEKELDSWMEWVKKITHTSSERRKIEKLLEGAANKLSQECGFDCQAIFLDAGIAYELIGDAINDFRDTLSKNKFISMVPDELKMYSTKRSFSESPYQMVEKVFKSMVENEQKAIKKRTRKKTNLVPKAKKKSSFEQPSLFEAEDKNEV